MKALVFDSPSADTGTTRIADLPDPAPGPGQIAIAVEFAGVNFKDVMQRRGDPGYVAAWPFVPGLEAVGRVRALGSGVTGISIGERVTAITGVGGLAETVVVDARLTAPLPPDLDPEEAAVAPAVLTTAELLLGTLNTVRPGGTVLLHSASGGVGQAVAAMAEHHRVGQLIGTVGAADRIVAARRSGYHLVVDRSGPWAEAVADAVPGGVDLVLDPLGTTLLQEDLAVLAPGGRITVFGNAGGKAPGALPSLPAVMSRNASIGGFSLAALCATAPDSVGAALKRVMLHVTTGEVSLDVTIVDGLEQAAQAQQVLATGSTPGKYVAKLRTD